MTSVNDLTDVGMKILHARALFDLISEWKAQGLPQSFVFSLQNATPETSQHEKTSGEIISQEKSSGGIISQEKEATDKQKDTMEQRLKEITEKLRLDQEVYRLKEQARQNAWRTCMWCHNWSAIMEKPFYYNERNVPTSQQRLWCGSCKKWLDHRKTVLPDNGFMPFS